MSWLSKSFKKVTGKVFGGTTGNKRPATGTTEYVKHMSKIVKLTYLQTIQALTDQNKLEDIAGTTDPKSQGFSTSSTSSVKRSIASRVLDPFSIWGGKGSRTTSVSFSSSDSGWSVTRTWLETAWDKIRYAIGVRDIQVFNFRFSPASEIVSKKFSAPKEIIKVQLQVDEQVPAIYHLNQRWIEYYITVDNGENWLRINPLDHPTLYLDGEIVPRTINFNIDIGGPSGDSVKNITTDAPVSGVRFRAVLRTDTSLEDGDRYTPTLKKYRLKLYPHGGLISNEGSI